MLNYSSEPAQISGSFLAYRNDILIFTEDNQKDKEFYACLLKRLVGDAISVHDVIPLGSRKNVLDACRASITGQRPELYVIDSDIDLINGGFQESHTNLYPLPVYCCENILFDEGSIVDLAYLDCGRRKRSEIQNDLLFEESVIAEFALIHDLFLHFSICRQADLPFTLNGYEEFFTDPNDDYSDKDIVRQKIDSLQVLLQNSIGDLSYSEKISNLRQAWPVTLFTISKIISGKSYLLPYIRRLITRLSGKKCYHSKESLKLRLVLSCSLEQLQPLRELMVMKVENMRASLGSVPNGANLT